MTPQTSSTYPQTYTVTIMNTASSASDYYDLQFYNQDYTTIIAVGSTTTIAFEVEEL